MTAYILGRSLCVLTTIQKAAKPLYLEQGYKAKPKQFAFSYGKENCVLSTI